MVSITLSWIHSGNLSRYWRFPFCQIEVHLIMIANQKDGTALLLRFGDQVQHLLDIVPVCEQVPNEDDVIDGARLRLGERCSQRASVAVDVADHDNGRHERPFHQVI